MAARVIFRCDASSRIGAGHVTRCLALADVFADLCWPVAFVCARTTMACAPTLAESGFEVRELDAENSELEALAQAARNRADLLVIDHYDRDAEFETNCRLFADKILVLDDATGRNHDCDFLVDPVAKTSAIYCQHVTGQVRVLIGPKYALIRKAFFAQRAVALRRRNGESVKEILVSCGATDPNNITARVLDSLEEISSDADITIVLSSQAQNLNEIRARLRQNMRLVVDSTDMAVLMSNADIAIGAAGVSAWERCCLGLPSIVIASAENQRGIVELLTATGSAVNGGGVNEDFELRLRNLITRLFADGQSRMRLAECASALVDGRGALRLAVELLGNVATRDGALVKFRLAEITDEEWLLELQRNPRTRRHSRNPSIPSSATHHGWLCQILSSTDKLLLVIEANGANVGTLRIDRLAGRYDKRFYEISIAIDPTYYRRGVGSAALRLLRRLLPEAELDATILPENTASQLLFINNGYSPIGGNVYRSHALGLNS